MEDKQREPLRLAVLHFEDLPDPRLERSKQHPLVNVVVIALSAVIAGAESFYEIEAFGQTKRAWLEQFLELANGIPSHDTFNRVFSLLEPAHFQACALNWVRSVVGSRLSAGDVLSIDGKQLGGSASKELRAVHMLNVWSYQHGLCLTSTAVDGKSNEITSVPGLLDTLSLLEIAGCTVTMDALNTQREVARKVRQHEAEYVMALKGKTTHEVRYYLYSFKAEAARVLHAVRTHWEVENKLHWTLDVVFGEDRHDYAERRGAETLSVLRQFALNLLRQDKFKGSVKGKRKKAAWDDDFRARILKGLLPN